MTIIPLIDLEFNTTNIPADTTPLWDIDAGYLANTTRRVDNKLYTNYQQIFPLCEYVYNNTDPLNPHYTTVANTELPVVDNTAVACTQNTTIVYLVEEDIYRQYTAVSTNVDFTTVNIATDGNFTTVTDYRHDIFNPVTDSAKWFDEGFTNKYKLLDTSLSSQTSITGDMEMSFIVNKIDSVYLFRLYGTSVTITVTQIDTATVLFDETITLTDKNSGGTHWGYYFNDFTFSGKTFAEVPLNFNMLVEITIANRDGESKCGMVGIGKSESLGATLYGSGAGIIDFSKKETNDFGETFLTQRDFKATNNLTVDVLAGRTDPVIERLTELRAIPIIYKGSDIYTSSIIFGIYNSWDVIFSNQSRTRLNINLESLT